MSRVLRGQRLLTTALAVAALGVSSSAASAAVIDFNTLPFGNPPVTVYTENGFTFTTTNGSFSGTSGNGNPAPSVYTPTNSGTADVTNGSTFTFNSVDLGNGAFSGTVNLVLTGLLGGKTLFTLTDSAAPLSFNTLSAGSFSSTVIDDLRLAVTGDGNLDNINVTPVAAAVSAAPEPASWALMLCGLGVMGLMVRRRREARATA